MFVCVLRFSLAVIFADIVVRKAQVDEISVLPKPSWMESIILPYRNVGARGHWWWGMLRIAVHNDMQMSLLTCKENRERESFHLDFRQERNGSSEGNVPYMLRKRIYLATVLSVGTWLSVFTFNQQRKYSSIKYSLSQIHSSANLCVLSGGLHRYLVVVETAHPLLRNCFAVGIRCVRVSELYIRLRFLCLSHNIHGLYPYLVCMGQGPKETTGSSWIFFVQGWGWPWLHNHK